MRAFCRLVDYYGADVPAEDIRRARALFEKLDDAVQFAFLLRVAAHLTRRLGERRPNPVARSAELLADWFLKPAA